MRAHRLLAVLGALALLSACGRGAVPLSPKSGENTKTDGTPPVVSPPASAPPASTVSIIAKAPSNCATFVLTQPQACAVLDVGTQGATQDPKAEPAPALVALDAALSAANEVELHQKLAALESCSHFEPGLILSLRADLAPPECADEIVSAKLADPKAALSLELHQLLRGQSIGARLLRAEVTPPVPQPPFTREHFEAFLKERIKPWYSAQSRAIFELSSEGAKLSGYGKAITAIEAGMSDLRFVESVRSVPLPEDMNRDPELVEVYGQSLEDALEPRKIRGRDAILVGLLHLGQQGVLNDARLKRAQAQLSKLFAGSRIDALSGLLLPPLPEPSTATVIERLAARLPPFFADRILTEKSLESPTVLRALMVRGLGPKIRQVVERRAYERADVARLYARALLEYGSKYFRPADFTRATIILGTKGSLEGAAARETRLIAALSHALEGGPENAVQLMLTGPMLPDSMGRIAQLQQLAKENSEIGGLAAYDAAHLMTVIPMREPNAAHWEKAAQSFDVAASKLKDPKLKSLAKARAEDARATAQTIRTTKPAGTTAPAPSPEKTAPAPSPARNPAPAPAPAPTQAPTH